MNFLLWVAFVALVFTIGSQLFVSLQLAKLRRSGEYPQPGKAMMADVERLLKGGLRVWAIRCYREIHACSLRQARDAVDALSAK